MEQSVSLRLDNHHTSCDTMQKYYSPPEINVHGNFVVFKFKKKFAIQHFIRYNIKNLKQEGLTDDRSGFYEKNP